MPNEDSLAIARIVRDRGPLSRAEIARCLVMSPSTVGRLVETLITQGLMRESGNRPGNSAGRPSIQLEFNPQFASVLTVDLRLTEAYAVVTDLCGQSLATATRPLMVADTRQSLQDLLSLIHDLVSSPIPSLKGIGPIQSIVIGAPSIVNAHSGIIEWAPSLGWNLLALRDLLAAEFQLATLVENDVNLAALGEYWKGAGQSVNKNMVFVSVGTGIGAGIIIDGRLYRGSTFAAGEVAYFITDVEVLRDNAWLVGSLENRVGRDGLIGMAQLIAQRYPASKLTEYFNSAPRQIDTRQILRLAAEGDQAAMVVFKELVDSLTIVICNIAVLLDPEMIVLGGPSDWEWSELSTAIKNRIGSALLRPIHLEPTRLGQDALIMGGAYSALSLTRFS